MQVKDIQNLDDVDLLLYYYSKWWKMFILAAVKKYSEARDTATLMELYAQEIIKRKQNRKDRR